MSELDRRNVTFAQAEGVVPLPQQLQRKEISNELRSVLWAIIYDSFSHDIETSRAYGSSWVQGNWLAILRQWHIFALHRFIDEFDGSASGQTSLIKGVIRDGSYIEVFDFLQFVVRSQKCPHDLAKAISHGLEYCRSAYRLIDKTFVPLGSDEEAAAIEKSLVHLAGERFSGARTHIRNAGSELTAGNWARSITESIHAVESVAKVLEPSAKTLGPALTLLERKGKMHGGLKAALGTLYGFTSDAEGIRHALVFQDAPNVDEADAQFMFGACASFVSYMITRGEQAD